MNIIYSDNRNIDKEKLVSLFEAVKWKSAEYPDKLQQAIACSHSVYTAWDNEKLVGLVNALSDGVMTVYYHYFLVHPDYQHQNIGFELMKHMKEHYGNFQTQILIAYANAVPFYEKCGFTAGAGETPLYISELV